MNGVMDHIAADRQILKRCISGEKRAQEEFVMRFSNPVYQCIQFTLKAKQIPFSRQDLEDLHNTVFLNLFDKRCKKLRQYKGKNGCSVFSWIRLITVRTVIDYIRKAGLDDAGNFRLQLMDGGTKNYRVDDCSEAQIKNVIEMLQKRGVPVEKLG